MIRWFISDHDRRWQACAQRFSFLLKFGPFNHCQIRGLGIGSSVLQAFDEGSAFFWGHFAQRLSLEGMGIRVT